MFFHKFFSIKNEKEQARADKSDKRKKKGEDEEEVAIEGASDIGEEEVWAVSLATHCI